MNNNDFIRKSEKIKNFFLSIPSINDRYTALIEIGRKLPAPPLHLKIAENLVEGCQSRLYLSSSLIDRRIYFEATADAFISLGLAALLITAYNGETCETVLKEPPVFLTEIGIHAALSPGRSNGLSNIHLRMKKDALKFLHT
ncbi:MAG TPA: SufE family protein [Chlamydiales bacterium]|nr:SufE family protein [Chlamydiales bacterium]